MIRHTVLFKWTAEITGRTGRKQQPFWILIAG